MLLPCEVMSCSRICQAQADGFTPSLIIFVLGSDLAITLIFVPERVLSVSREEVDADIVVDSVVILAITAVALFEARFRYG